MHPSRPSIPLVLLLAGLLQACATRPTLPLLPIGHVQGSGMESPLTGRHVRIQGVVTADFREGLGLLAIQDSGDGDPSTSDALFLVDAPATLRVGQAVSVSGTVEEIESGRDNRITALRVLETRLLKARPMPAPTPLEAVPADAAGWERLEAMRVHVPLPLTLTGSYNAARFGEWQAVFGDRLQTPTEIALPGRDAAEAARRNRARSLWLDDGSTRERPAHPMAREVPRIGSRIIGVKGIVDERHGRHRLQLPAMPRIEPAARPAAPARGGEVRVVAFNLQNLFNGDGRGGGFPTARGARTEARYLAQRARLVEAMAALDADILVLAEMENDGQGPLSSEAQLLAALNERHGGDWRAIPVPANANDDAIRNSVLYRAGRVQAQSAPLALDAGPFAERNRPALAARFRAGDGPVFAVVANHLKSKGCRDAVGADRDIGDGQGCWNATRLDSVQRLHAWVGQHFAAMPVLMLGDFNAYAMEDPPRWLRESGWRDALADHGDAIPYSYVHEGQAGRLDHAFANASMAERLQDATEWHINADEPDVPDLHPAGGPWRSSDHDPLVLDLRLRSR